MKHVKKLTATIGLGIGLAMATVSASAAVKWAFQDDDIDFLWRPNATATGGTLINPSTCVGAACNITVGDVLISIFEFPSFTIGGVNAIPAGMELTGVAAIQYLGDAPVTPFGPQRVFGAYAGGLNQILALGDGADPTVTGGAAGESAMVAMWLNSNTNAAGEDRNLVLDTAVNLATNCTSLADCLDEASKGTLIQVDGGIFADGTKLDPDNFWFGGNPAAGTNITAVAGLSENIIVVGVVAGLSTLFNPVMPIIQQDLSGNPSATCVGGLDGCVDFRVTASVNGGNGLSNGSFAHSTSIAASKFVVPEPGSLALLGAALLGLVGFQRRKR